MVESFVIFTGRMSGGQEMKKVITTELYYIEVVYNCFICGKSLGLTSFHMQFEKIGCGLLQEAFMSEGSVLLAEREGEIRRDRSWKTPVNIEVLRINQF